jgi:hypothetical protein
VRTKTLAEIGRIKIQITTTMAGAATKIQEIEIGRVGTAKTDLGSTATLPNRKTNKPSRKQKKHINAKGNLRKNYSIGSAET